MRTILISLAAAGLVLALAPTASAVDLCDKYGLCLPPTSGILNGCHYNAIYVRGDLPTQGCAPEATLYSCDVTYMGGSPDFWGNFRFMCEPMTTLP